MHTILKATADILSPKYGTFEERIEFLISHRGISKMWLADKLGITKQALNYLIKHSSKPKYIDILAEIMNANPDWIEFGRGRPFEDIISKDLVAKLKIYTSETLVQYLNGDSGLCDQDKFVDYNNTNLENFLAFQLQNNSVFPPFIENTVFIFEKNKNPENGDYVLITLEDNHSVLVRQYLKDGMDTYYNAKNENYRSFINIDAKILGVLIEARYLL